MINVYAFLSDTDFVHETDRGFVDNRGEDNTQLDDNQINMFDKPYVITDSHDTSRHLYVDANQIEKGVLDLLEIDSELSKLITDISNVDAFTLAQLEERCVEENDNYIENTLNRSTKVFSVHREHDTAFHIPEWIKFAYSFENTDGDTTEVLFKLWLHHTPFEEQYPIATIVRVVPIIDPAVYLDTSLMKNSIDTLIQSGTYAFNRLHTEINASDHTGLLVYESRFINTADAVYRVPFGILYKGHSPDSLAVRKAIRSMLLDLKIADEDVWKSRFPDLFIQSQFFMYPMWTNIEKRPERDIYPSIQKVKPALDKAIDCLPEMDRNFILDHLEFVNDISFITTCSVPDPNNETVMSVREWLNTYQAHAKSDPGFRLLDEKAKDFAIKFSDAISIIRGELDMKAIYLKNTFFNREYLSFSSEYVEYHIYIKDVEPEDEN